MKKILLNDQTKEVLLLDTLSFFHLVLQNLASLCLTILIFSFEHFVFSARLFLWWCVSFLHIFKFFYYCGVFFFLLHDMEAYLCQLKLWEFEECICFCFFNECFFNEWILYNHMSHWIQNSVHNSSGFLCLITWYAWSVLCKIST